MRIRVIWIARTDRGFVQDGVAHYLTRVRRTWDVQEVVVAEEGRGDAAHQQRVEGERLLAVLQPGERVVVLDERGKGLGSVEFADRLGRWRDQGVRQVAFVVGGSYGLSDAVRQRADLLLSLSPMTFPHQLVRLLFAEQLYRAVSILGGTAYHH
ncbi:MAG: 23S rRNA (pseudouridine(1915)-N(3))-methyltransferase RlmH [Flavobacteriales bacterium]